jgi:hypothetical protein
MVVAQAAQMESSSTLPGLERTRGIKGEVAGLQLREKIQISDTELKVNSFHY